MSSFVLRDLTHKEDREYTSVILYHYKNPQEAQTKLQLLREDEHQHIVHIMVYGELNELKDACNKYPLLASSDNGSNLSILEDVKCYQLYNSYEIKGNRKIHSSTHDLEEAFDSLQEVVGEFTYGIIIYE